MHNDADHTPYMQRLLANDQAYQDAIENLLEVYRVQPVGNGYIDLILPCDRAILLIEELTKLPVAVTNLTWWCCCTPESKVQFGCPHGMGGPLNRFGEGWFSECVHFPFFEVENYGISQNEGLSPASLASQCRDVIRNYLQNQFTAEPWYSPCLYCGLWLLVPNHWQRRNYI